MRTFLFLSALIASASCFIVDNGKSKSVNILGGQPVTIDAVPYQVQILFGGLLECGATIIFDYWILSAAHCFYNETRHITVITGSDQAKIGQQREIEKIISHPNYNADTFDNDIALVKLVEPIVFNNKQQRIEITRVPPKVGQSLQISGFGRIKDDGPISRILKVAWIPVVNHAECQKAYHPNVITTNMFCAGVGNTDSCEGDSGGPAVIDGKLVGIVSWGSTCGSPKYPGIYTELDRYCSWISKVTGLPV